MLVLRARRCKAPMVPTVRTTFMPLGGGGRCGLIGAQFLKRFGLGQSAATKKGDSPKQSPPVIINIIELSPLTPSRPGLESPLPSPTLHPIF